MKIDLEKSIPVYEKSRKKFMSELEIANMLSESNLFDSPRASIIGESNAAQSKEELAKTEAEIADSKTELEEINNVIASLKSSVVTKKQNNDTLYT